MNFGAGGGGWGKEESGGGGGGWGVRGCRWLAERSPGVEVTSGRGRGRCGWGISGWWWGRTGGSGATGVLLLERGEGGRAYPLPFLPVIYFSGKHERGDEEEWKREGCTCHGV